MHPQSMKNQAWQISSPGVLKLKDLDSPLPSPGPKQVLVRIHAVAFNYRDILVVDHSPNYPGPHKPDLVPGADGAGTVEAVGANSIWAVGDRVVIHPNTWLSGLDPRLLDMTKIAGAMDQDGTLRRYLVWDDERLFRAPKHLSFEEASALWGAGVTAYRALFYGPLKFEPGMTVLTQGTGGVSCFAIQLAAAAGATVIATSSSDEKLEVARRLGAKHVINYRTQPDWEVEVLKATNNVGVDLVVDVAGAQSIEHSIKSLRFGGAVVILGLLSEDPFYKVNIVQDILYGAKTVVGLLGGGNREMAEGLVDFFEKHQLRPEIAQIFEWEQADKALAAIAKLQAPGKIVARV